MARSRRTAHAAAPREEEVRPPPSPYLLDGARDLTLVIAPPVWILPLLYGLGFAFGDRPVNEAVMALGAIGHHLPGMLRAYGDRALFRRWRARFVLAPLLLAPLCVAFSRRGLHALTLVAFVWGVWHAILQSYGFVRIYAAKAGLGDRLHARADLALLAAWFVAGVLRSPLRLHFLVEAAATCGAPLPPAGLLDALRLAALGAVAAATASWLVVALRARRRGVGPGRLRVALLLSSVAFWWFANVRVRHPLLGMPLFELFHDVQYLAIVWAFQRRLTGGKSDLAAPLRALFRPSLLAAAAYVALCAGYGAIGLAAPAGPLGATLGGLLTASQLLHFYYDGFLWKVRDPATAAPLGLRGEGAPVRALWPTVRVAALVLGATILLGAGELSASVPARARVATVAALFPDAPLAQLPAAELHWERHEVAAALDGYRRTLALDPSYQVARDHLALSLGELADGAARAGDEATLARYVDELASLRPGLSGEIARFADERVAAYRR